EEEDKSKLFFQAEERKKQTMEELEKAITIFKEQEGKKEERENVRKNLDRLNEFLPIVQDMDSNKKELLVLQEKEKNASRDLEKVKTEIDNQQKAQEKNHEKII